METLIGLMGVSGPRVGEVIRLDRDDVDFDQGALAIRNSKAGQVPCGPVACEHHRRASCL